MSGGNYPQGEGRQQYPQQPYPQQQYQQPYGQTQQGYNQSYAMKPDRGGMLLAFSLIGLLACPIFAVIGFFMAKSDLNEIRQGVMIKTGESLTTAAYWISLAAIILWGLFIALYILGFVLFFGAGGMSTM